MPPPPLPSVLSKVLSPALAAAFFSTVFAGSLCHAQSPELTRITPYSGCIGETVSFSIEGKNLVAPKSLWTDFGGSCSWADTASSPRPGSSSPALGGTLTLPNTPTAPAGFLHLITASGLSNPLLFLVDDLPVLRKNPPRRTGSSGNSPDAPIPHAFAGHTNTAETSVIQIHLEKGASISAEVYAIRIGSKLDPQLRIRNPEGKVCAAADDTAGLGGDCRLRFRAEHSGTYLVELRDAAFKGGPDYFYHLRLADFPLVEAVYPPVVEAGMEQLFTALDSNGVSAAPPLRLRIPAHATATVPIPFRFTPQGNAALCSVRASEVPVVAESIEKPVQAPVLTQTCVVVGRLAAAAEVDTYTLDLRKEDRLRISSLTREIGSPAILYLRLESDQGAVLASNDSGGANADAELPLSFKAPKDGRYTLRIQDVARRGAPALTYAARVEFNPAPFEISVASPRFVAPQGGTFQAKITAQRTGTGEPIHIALESADASPLPADLRVEDNVIAKGKTETLLRVILPPGLPANTLRHIQFRGSVESKTPVESATASFKSANKKNNAQSNDWFASVLEAMPNPPRLLTEAFGLCVGPDTPDFFKIETLDRGALLPRGLGRSQFVLRQTALDKAFTSNAEIRFENVPEGISIKSDRGRGGRVSGQVDFVCELEGPIQPREGALSFDIVALADFKGATKQVRVSGVPLQVVDPVEISLSVSPSPLRPGSSGTLRVQVVRHDASRPAPVNLSAEGGIPPGLTLPATLPTIPADKSEVDIPFTVAADAPDTPKDARGMLRLRAASMLGKENVSTFSPPLRIEIER